jgi:hypothetical protein
MSIFMFERSKINSRETFLIFKSCMYEISLQIKKFDALSWPLMSNQK